MVKTNASFDERLKAAVASGSSAAVGALIAEAEATRSDALATVERARARALDPLLEVDAVDAARAAAADAEFRAQRMTTAAAFLHEKRQEFAAAEEQGERRRTYDAALAQRDEAAQRLAAEYPELANRLGELLAAVHLADAVVEAANGRLPEGAARLEGVEATARPGYEPHRANAPSLVRINLPAFDPKAADPTWGEGLAANARRPVFRPDVLRLGGDVVAKGEAA